MEINKTNYQYKNLLIIGNGFDKDLGLPTTYKEFVNSSIFEKMYAKRSKENARPSLLHYLYGRRFYDKWYDIELAMLEYVSRRPDGSYVNNVEVDKRDYELLCSTFAKYLKSLFNGKGQKMIDLSNKMCDSPAGRLLREIIKVDCNVVYSFNYTPINLIICNLCGRQSYHKEAIRLHGCIDEESVFSKTANINSIILGIETVDVNSIAPGYSFLIKSNSPNYKPSTIAADLIASQRVIIFGHSMNKMDFGYFEDYFKSLTINEQKDRELIIITRDNESKKTILDNLRQMGISVLKMFAHTNVIFILTSNMKNKSGEDIVRFENLINGLLL